MKLLTLAMMGAMFAPQVQPRRLATLTKEQIIVGLRQRRSQYEHFRAQYTCRYLDAKGNLVSERRIGFARDGERRFTQIEILAPGSPPQRLTAAFDGQLTRQLNPLRQGTISTEKSLIADGYDLLNSSLHLPVTDASYAVERDPDGIGLLPATIEHDRYLVLPEQQQVGERWTHVLWVEEPASQTRDGLFVAYWIDPDLEFELVKSESRTKDWVYSRLTHHDHQPAGERVVPRRIVQEWYKPRSREVQGTSTITIDEAFVGPIPDDTFQSIFPPGTLVADITNGTSYKIPGPSADLDKLSEHAKREILDFQSRMAQPPGSRTRWWLWGGVALAIGVAGGLIWRKHHG